MSRFVLSIMTFVLISTSVPALANGLGACVVSDAFTNLPTAEMPPVGVGHAKRDLDLDTLEELLVACTDRVYTQLMRAYCGRNRDARPVQRSVQIYSPDGSISVTSCAAYDILQISSNISWFRHSFA